MVIRAVSPPASRHSGRFATAAMATAVIVLVGLAYSDALRGPFVLDDPGAIPWNVTLRHWSSALFPPSDATVGGRPVLNLSLAINFHLGGIAPAGYRIGNLIIHVAAALALFGLARRLLRTLDETWRRDADGVAAVAALLWALHPLQTEAVTYVVQRAESLMGCFYLLCLYAYVRHAQAETPRWAWGGLSVLACLLGVGTKEVMVSAPLMAYVLDAAFLSQSWGEPWRRRGRLLVLLFATWVPLGLLVWSTHGRNGTAGFGLGFNWWRFFRTQCAGILRYLRLAVWPAGQVFDYGSYWVDRLSVWLPCGLALLGLFAAVLWALRRHARIGAAGLWVFAVLAPTSLVPGVRQTLAEHRMYLALAPLAVLLTATVRKAAGRRGLVALGLAVVALATVTYCRNRVYRSEAGLWADTLAKRPDSMYALNNYGGVLLRQGNATGARTYFERALRIQPDYVDALVNEAQARGDLGDKAGERRLLGRALALEPDNPYAENNYATLLSDEGRDAEAARRLSAVLNRRPGYREGHSNYGNALLNLGRLSDAAVQYRTALALDPTFAPGWNGLGEVLFREGGVGDSRKAFEQAMRCRPHYADAEANDAEALAKLGDTPGALRLYAQAASDAPARAAIRYNFGNLLLRLGRYGDAAAQYAQTVRLEPAFVKAHYNYGVALYRGGSAAASEREFREAVRLDPGWADAHNNLGAILLLLHRPTEAVAEIQEALRLDPKLPGAAGNLATARASLARQP